MRDDRLNPAAPNRTLTSLYALGWTQHSIGAQNIRTLAILQLLLGNIGMPGGGANALRGHSNIQGLTDLGLLSDQLPGYMNLARDEETTRAAYLEKRTPKPLRPGQVNFWSNYPKFHTSLMKAWYGKAAVCAFVIICGIIVHIYAALWIKGTLGAMVRGTVTQAWARKHHPGWYRRVMRGEEH